MKSILIILALIGQANAFTLNTNINAGFDSDIVKFYVTSNSSCANAGLTQKELLSIASDAAHNFWNKVPTSSLRLKEGGIYTTSEDKFLTGILLCLNTGCDESAVIPAVTNIIIACNSDTTVNFPNFNRYALTMPNNFSSKKIKGSIILINDSANTAFHQLSREEMVNVLAHEMGHAIGLGHSQDKAALMYHTSFSNRDRLGQDDIDGVSYLYPNKLHGCSSIFGVIDSLDSDDIFPSGGHFILTFLLSMLAVIAGGKKIRNWQNRLEHKASDHYPTYCPYS